MIATFPAGRIFEVAFTAGVPSEAIQLADAEYAEFTAADVQKVGNATASVLRQLGVVWDEEVFDCDDITLLACAVARVLHKKNNRVRAGIAFGEVWCRELQHAFCFAVHGAALKFYEPQSVSGFPMRELALTPEQIRSIHLLKA